MALGVLGMEVFRVPVRVPTGAKRVMTMVHPSRSETAPDGSESVAHIVQPRGKTPAGVTDRLDETRGFGLGKVRREAVGAGGKLTEPLDRRLDVVTVT